MVKLELYRVFREVAEAGNISLAAENLYLSQSAVSQISFSASWLSRCSSWATTRLALTELISSPKKMMRSLSRRE